jgi:hypothetical protein
MVTSNTDSPDNTCDVVDKRTMELMAEFEQHYHDAIEIEPTAEGRREHVFHAWTFQKLAGIQISIEEIARKFNAHLGCTE